MDQPSSPLFRVSNCCRLTLLTVPPDTADSAMKAPLAALIRLVGMLGSKTRTFGPRPGRATCSARATAAGAAWAAPAVSAVATVTTTTPRTAQVVRRRVILGRRGGPGEGLSSDEV